MSMSIGHQWQYNKKVYYKLSDKVFGDNKFVIQNFASLVIKFSILIIEVYFNINAF